MATIAQHNWWEHPNSFVNVLPVPVDVAPVPVAAPQVPVGVPASSASLFWRVSRSAPWEFYGSYGAATEAQFAAKALRGRGFETAIR